MYWQALNKQNSTNPQRKKIQEQIGFVIDKFCVTHGDLMSTRRDSANARQVLMFRLYYHCHMSYTQVGNFMGKDHSTVVHAVRKLTHGRDKPSPKYQMMKQVENLFNESMEMEWDDISDRLHDALVLLTRDVSIEERA